MRDTINVKGLSDLDKFLSELPAKMEKNIMRGAMRAAAEPIAARARQNVSVVSGVMQKGIVVKTGSKNGTVYARVVVTGEHAFAARWVEFGTAAHYMKPKKSKSLFFAGLFSEGIDHPGGSAKPFMRPALDSGAQTAVLASAKYIKKRLTKNGLNTTDLAFEAS